MDEVTLSAEEKCAQRRAHKRAVSAAWRERNLERVREKDRAYRAANLEKIKAYLKAYVAANRETLRAQCRERYWANKDEANRQSREYHRARYRTDADFRAAVLARSKAHYEASKEANCPKLRARQRKSREMYLSTEAGRFREKVRKLVDCTLRRHTGYAKRGRVEELLGYSLGSLRSHLEGTIPVGWTWDDYLSGRLHLDHIVPSVAFNFQSAVDHDFRRCWAIKNLRLLPAIENCRKGAKLTKPFQPTLL